MASEADFLTTHKNGVVAVNNLSQTWSSWNTSSIAQNNYFKGQKASSAVSAQTLVYAGSGFLVSISVTVSGTASGTVNNSATTGGAAAANALAAIPTTIGVFQIGARFTSGLVISPGTGQSVVAIYSTD